MESRTYIFYQYKKERNRGVCISHRSWEPDRQCVWRLCLGGGQPLDRQPGGRLGDTHCLNWTLPVVERRQLEKHWNKTPSLFLFLLHILQILLCRATEAQTGSFAPDAALTAEVHFRDTEVTQHCCYIWIWAIYSRPHSLMCWAPEQGSGSPMSLVNPISLHKKRFIAERTAEQSYH